jgi:putative membrane protein
MIFAWPLPGSYNIPFGELSVLFGALFLGAGLALLKEWSLVALGVYAVLAGLAAIVVGVRFIDLKMSQAPLISGIGFILSGLSGLMTLPVYVYKKGKALRIIAIVVLLAAAAIWAFTGYGSYWSHLEGFSKWAPMPAAPK